MKSKTILAASLATFITCAMSHAATQTWDNGSTDFAWSTTALNWDAGSAWTNGNDAVFGSTGIGTVTIASGVTANSVTFNTTGYTLAGGPLALTGTAAITANANATLAAALTGNLTKAGTGTLIVSSTNTGIGSATINGGVLDVTGYLFNPNNFGGGLVKVNTGGTLRMYGWGYASDGLGQLADSTGTLVVDGGTIEMAGNNSSGGTSRDFAIGTAGATLAVASGMTWNVGSGWPDANPVAVNSSLTLDGAGTGHIYKAVAGTGTLTKNGTGTWILSGADTYTGATTVTGGTLTVTHSNFADDKTITIASGAHLNLPTLGIDVVGDLILDGVTQLNGIYDSTNSGGAITGIGKIQVGVPATLTWNASQNTTWDATAANWTGTRTIWEDNDTAIFNGAGVGTVNIATGIIAAGVTFDTAGYTIAGGSFGLTGTTPTITANADATISSVLSPLTTLTKAGNGTLTLSGNSQSTNLAINITAGTVDLAGQVYQTPIMRFTPPVRLPSARGPPSNCTTGTGCTTPWARSPLTPTGWWSMAAPLKMSVAAMARATSPSVPWVPPSRPTTRMAGTCQAIMEGQPIPSSTTRA